MQNSSFSEKSGDAIVRRGDCEFRSKDLEVSAPLGISGYSDNLHFLDIQYDTRTGAVMAGGLSGSGHAKAGKMAKQQLAAIRADCAEAKSRSNQDLILLLENYNDQTDLVVEALKNGKFLDPLYADNAGFAVVRSHAIEERFPRRGFRRGIFLILVNSLIYQLKTI